VIKTRPSDPMLVNYVCVPSPEGSEPFIDTWKGVNIFLKCVQQSGMDFDGIGSFGIEKFDNYMLFDFRVHDRNNVL
jgi:hypothetical protein